MLPGNIPQDYLIRKSPPGERTKSFDDRAEVQLQILYPATSIHDFVRYDIYDSAGVDKLVEDIRKDQVVLANLPSYSTFTIFLQPEAEFYFVPAQNAAKPLVEEAIRAAELITLAHRWFVFPIVVFNRITTFTYVPKKTGVYIAKHAVTGEFLDLYTGAQLSSIMQINDSVYTIDDYNKQN